MTIPDNPQESSPAPIVPIGASAPPRAPEFRSPEGEPAKASSQQKPLSEEEAVASSETSGPRLLEYLAIFLAAETVLSLLVVVGAFIGLNEDHRGVGPLSQDPVLQLQRFICRPTCRIRCGTAAGVRLLRLRSVERIPLQSFRSSRRQPGREPQGPDRSGRVDGAGSGFACGDPDLRSGFVPRAMGSSSPCGVLAERPHELGMACVGRGWAHWLSVRSASGYRRGARISCRSRI